MKQRIKKFGLRIWAELETHLAKYIAGMIIVVLAMLCIISWNWLKTKHALEMLGWAWVAVTGGIIFFSAVIFWLLIREPKTTVLTDEQDIKNELYDYWVESKRAHAGNHRWSHAPPPEFIIYCSNVDKRRNLKKGSAAKFLPEIMGNDSAYCIKSKGKETIVVQRKGLTTTMRAP